MKNKPTLSQILALQSAEGFWHASALPLLEYFFRLPLPVDYSPEVLTTIAALYVLEEFFGEKQSEWTMIALKAKTYLTSIKISI